MGAAAHFWTLYIDLPHSIAPMLSFAFQSTIADVDDTVEGEPCHPATVLILEMDNDFIGVIVPDAVLASRRERLGVGESVSVGGEFRDSPYGPQHVATALRLEGRLH